MKFRGVIGALALLLMVFPAQAKGKKQTNLPAIFRQARYVYVEAVDGREFDPNLDAADREAIADVRDALRAWNHYSVTGEREQADLVVVVRKGREPGADESGADTSVSRDGGPDAADSSEPSFPGRQRATGPIVAPEGDIGSTQDLFKVCQLRPNGKLGNPLWSRTLPGGLNTPQLLLFQQFKDAVEQAYPRQTTTPPSKP